MKNNFLESKNFTDLALRVLKKAFKGKRFEKRSDEIKKIIGEREYVLGRTFYSVCNYLEINIDDFCAIVFKGHKWLPLFEKQDFKTKLQGFVAPYINSANDVCDAAGIESTRFSRLQKGEFKDLYASEVYGLARSFGLKPSRLFHYFYGDGERPMVSV